MSRKRYPLPDLRYVINFYDYPDMLRVKKTLLKGPGIWIDIRSDGLKWEASYTRMASPSIHGKVWGGDSRKSVVRQLRKMIIFSENPQLKDVESRMKK